MIETKVPDGTSTTVYRCGPMIDLCVGPHIPHTGKIKAFMITKARLSSPRKYFVLIHFQNSASYFLGDANNDSLQRIYGISFPDKKQLTEYKAFLAEAARRDHRKIGKVFFHFVKHALSLDVARNKIFSSSTISVQEAVSSILTVPVSITPCWS